MPRCIANKSLERWAKYKEGDEVKQSHPECVALVLLGHARWEDEPNQDVFTQQGQRRRGRPTNAEREARAAAQVGAVVSSDFKRPE